MKKIIWVLIAAAMTGIGCSDTGSGTAATVTANAGATQKVLVSSTATLDGSASVGVTKSSWTFTAVPTGSTATIKDSTTLTPTFVADKAGTYTLQLSVNNGASTATTTVTAQSVVAKITIGSSVSTRTRFNTTEDVVNLEQTGATLSGASSQVASGNTIATYTWTQVSGPTATATSGTASSTYEFTAPSLVNFLDEQVSSPYKWQVLPVAVNDTQMVFRLTVTDSAGNTDSATANVYVQDSGTEILPSKGLPNVSLGNTITLSGPEYKPNTGSTDTNTPITDWTWTLTPPAGSAAVFADTGTTTSNLEFPKFTADVQGNYSVAYSSTSGATNGTILLNAGKYVGVGTIGGTTPANPQCGTCHGTTPISGEDDKVTPWSGTKHASLFSDNITTYAGLAPTPYLWQYDTVGYGANSASNGFDTLASTYGFTFPSAGMTYSAFTTNYPGVAVLANNQCENCHGPGSGHSGNPSNISVSYSQFEVCGQCHTQEAEWVNSVHNSTVEQGTWISSTGCVRCHSASGFDTYISGGTLAAITETGAFPGQTCAACHDPHDATNSYQLRLQGNVTMIVDGSTVDAGIAAVCYTCHDAFYEYNQKDCDSNGDGVADALCTTNDQAATQYMRQVHHNPQAAVLEGKGALTDLQNGDGTGTDAFTLGGNSFHSGSDFILSKVTGNTSLSSTNDKCITCHMATGPGPSEDGYQHLGGHSFAMSSGDTDHTSACTPCHTTLTDFNRLAREDWDGDGTVAGIQDEVQGLVYELSVKIKGLDTAHINQSSGPTSATTVTKSSTITYTGTKSSLPTGKNCTTTPPSDGTAIYQPCNFLNTNVALKRAIWNYNMLVQEGSFGVHNASFDIQVLQKTFTALDQILGAGTATFIETYPNACLRRGTDDDACYKTY